jgi:hypothetical protein
MSFTKEQLVGIGQRHSAELMVPWAKAVAKAAGKDLKDLHRFGVTSATLAKVKSQISEVAALAKERTQLKSAAHAATVQQSDAHEAALDWWHDAKVIALNAFEGDPDRLALFRTGVKVGRSIPHLEGELRTILGLFKSHEKDLASFGGTAAFHKDGAARLATLEAAGTTQESEHKIVPASTEARDAKKGELYVLVRRIVRSGRRAFKGSKRVDPYSNSLLKRDRNGRKAARTRKAKKASPPKPAATTPT